MKKVFLLAISLALFQVFSFCEKHTNVILLEAPQNIPFNVWKNELKEKGIILTHAFPPAGGLVVSEDDIILELYELEDFLGTKIYYESPSGEEEKRLKSTTEGNILWNAQRALLKVDGKCEDTELPQGLPLINDLFIPEIERSESGEPLGSCTSTSLKYSGSEYLLGNVSVNVILPESNGATDPSTEDWNATLETNVQNEIVEGLNELRNLYPRFVIRKRHFRMNRERDKGNLCAQLSSKALRTNIFFSYLKPI